MKKFNFYENGKKCSLTHIESENKITGIRARIAFLLCTQVGTIVAVEKITAVTHNESHPDYYMIRSMDVHLIYVKKFFNECSYDFLRVRNEGITITKIENVV